MKRYIYVLDSTAAGTPSGSKADPGVVWARSPLTLATAFSMWRELLGTGGTLRVLARLCKGRRAAGLMRHESRSVGYVIVTRGFCRHYSIGERDGVIGPVFVRSTCRGQGLGARLTTEATRWLSGRGCMRIWIDTTDDNPRMMAIVQRCGFKEQVNDCKRL